MSRLHDRVAGRIDKADFFSCVRTPKTKYERDISPVQRFDDRIRKTLPPLARMGSRLMRFHRQNRVEKQDALVCPGGQIAMLGSRYAEIAFQLSKNIAPLWYGSWPSNNTRTSW